MPFNPATARPDEAPAKPRFNPATAKPVENPLPATPAAAAPAEPPVSRGYDVLRSVGTGLRSAAEHGVGLYGDLNEIADAAGRKVSSWLGTTPEEQAAVDKARASGPMGWTHSLAPPSGEDISRNVTTPVVGEHYQPQTPIGEKARDLSEFTGGMIAGPKNLLTRFGTRVVAPWAGAEGGEKIAEATGLDKYAPAFRFGGALLGGGAASAMEPSRFVEAAKSIATNPDAMKRYGDLLRQSGMDENSINAAMAKLGDLSNPMDVSKPMAWQGGRVVAAGGEAGNTISEALKRRHEGGNPRIRDTVNEFGPQEDPSQVRLELANKAKEIGKEYPAAHAAQSEPVNTQAIADELDADLATARGSISPTLQAIKDSLYIKGGDPANPDTMHLDPSTEGLHAARKDIGNRLYDGEGNIRSNLGSEEAGRLKYYYGKVTEALQGASEPFKSVDTRYSLAKDEARAFEQGRKTLDSGRDAPTPGDLNRQIDAGGPVIKTALGRGTIADLHRVIGQNANDRLALERLVKGEGDWNRDKLTSLFGPEKAQKLFDVLAREKVFTETKNSVTGGSPTASRQGDKFGAFGGLSASDAIRVGGLTAIPRALAMRVVDKMLDNMQASRGEARDVALADILSGKVSREGLAKAMTEARNRPSRLTGPLIGGVLSQNKEKDR
jgi:hypothetical protein